MGESEELAVIVAFVMLFELVKCTWDIAITKQMAIVARKESVR